MMMRISSLLTLGIVACGAALASSEPTTYVSGDLTGVKPNSGGTLSMTDDKELYFRTAQTSVPVAYDSISKVELGAIKSRPRPHDPVYKVWSIQKRFTSTKTQNLTLQFKNETGEEKTMTLELAHANAADVLATIKRHVAGKYAAGNAEWWGDDFWKTTRNAERWNNTVATNGSKQ
jgi:hypothetical protein